MSISEHGAKIAASRLGITVEEYRSHRDNGERWCPDCQDWRPETPNPAYCREHWRVRCREQQRARTGIHYAGPAHSRGEP